MKKILQVILFSQIFIYSGFVSAKSCSCGHGSAVANGCSADETCQVGGTRCMNLPNHGKGQTGNCVK